MNAKKPVYEDEDDPYLIDPAKLPKIREGEIVDLNEKEESSMSSFPQQPSNSTPISTTEEPLATAQPQNKFISSSPGQQEETKSSPAQSGVVSSAPKQTTETKPQDNKQQSSTTHYEQKGKMETLDILESGDRKGIKKATGEDERMGEQTCRQKCSLL
ncbi:unnamed protein product [Blepharisma stoltei]|uniref:Uncharacterized protein n=1 Tax=Blepharisma stoltei TaxID=1481888 RepID=A0AAU9J370_9CILI|nr:unnamed protein product [Blepharisma stoltei]